MALEATAGSVHVSLHEADASSRSRSMTHRRTRVETSSALRRASRLSISLALLGSRMLSCASFGSDR